MSSFVHGIIDVSLHTSETNDLFLDICLHGGFFLCFGVRYLDPEVVKVLMKHHILLGLKTVHSALKTYDKVMRMMIIFL